MEIFNKRLQAERVDISGSRLDITKSLNSTTSSTTAVSASTKDAPGSDAFQWNNANSINVFYVVLTLSSGMNPPSTLHVKIS
jgi:hypothetical protein